MLSSLKLEALNPSAIRPRTRNNSAVRTDTRRCHFRLRRPAGRSTFLTVQSGSDAASPSISDPLEYTSAVGSSLMSSSLQLTQWNLTQRHITILNLIACATAISATWLFCSAIPALLAFKRAAESLEKLMDVTREELPDTMAAIRLSGMEISDLTMELSDLGQEITQGVRSSTRAVRLAEERLSGLTNMTQSASLQTAAATMKTKSAEPILARTARGIREGIVKGRGVLQVFFTLTRFSRLALKYLAGRRPR